MSLSAKEAADFVGLSKDGLLKAIRNGKISAEKNINGEWRIEPVELFRVYPPVASSPQTNGTNDHHLVADHLQTSADSSTDRLQREIELLREIIQRQDEVVVDLRHRLDVESDKSHRLTMILEASPPIQAPAPPIPIEPTPQRPRSWWQRLLGGE